MTDDFARLLAELVEQGEAVPAAAIKAADALGMPPPTIRQVLRAQQLYPNSFRTEPEYRKLIR